MLSTFPKLLPWSVSRKNFNFSEQIYQGCPPGPKISKSDTKFKIDHLCLKSNAKALRKIDEIANLRHVVLIARWSIYATGERYGNDKHKKMYVVTSTSDEYSPKRSLQNLSTYLARAIEDLEKKKIGVILLTQVPSYPVPPKRCYQLAAYSNKGDAHCAINRKVVRKRQKEYRQLFSSLKNQFSNLTIIETNEKFCDEISCSIKLNDTIAYKDDDHLLPAASLYLLNSLSFSQHLSKINDQP